MIIASLFGDPIGAIAAAVIAPLCFVILFVLLARDPGPRRHVTEGHPAYVAGREDLAGDDQDQRG